MSRYRFLNSRLLWTSTVVKDILTWDFISYQVINKEAQLLVFTIPIFEPLPSQYYIRAVSDRWLGAEAVCIINFQHLILPERHPPHTGKGNLLIWIILSTSPQISLYLVCRHCIWFLLNLSLCLTYSLQEVMFLIRYWLDLNRNWIEFSWCLNVWFRKHCVWPVLIDLMRAKLPYYIFMNSTLYTYYHFFISFCFLLQMFLLCILWSIWDAMSEFKILDYKVRYGNAHAQSPLFSSGFLFLPSILLSI